MNKSDGGHSLRVKSTHELAPGYAGIVFERPRLLNYEAGDWLDLSFPNADLAGGKTYSFASSPTEPDVLIAYKHGVSPFKRALMAVESGDSLLVTDHGGNDFHLHKKRPSVLIAGGIGIAPFRSMIEEVVDQQEAAGISLVYLHQTDDFPYQDELDRWATGHPNVQCTYIVTAGLKRKDRARQIAAAFTPQNQRVLIAGPPGFVESTGEIVLAMGVSSELINKDSFDGY